MNNALQIIGLSGTNGSGKDTIGELLAEKHGYLFISGSDLIRDEARARGLPVTREVLRTISAEWRREHGLGAIIDMAVEKFKASGKEYKGLVTASLRNPGEADRVHELTGKVIWVDAEPRVRYDRIQAGAHLRGRTGEDDRTFEQWQADEAAEMQSSGDEATLNMSAVKEKSDIFLFNNGNDIEAFKRDVETELAKHGFATA